MKKIFSVTAAAFLLCQGSHAQKEKQETIEGNGRVITRDIPVASFTSLKADGIFQLKISQGNTESVKLEGDENLLAFIEIKNEGSTLHINTDKLKNKNVNIKSKKGMQVHITYKNINRMELNMVGNVQSGTTLSFDKLDFNNRGVGNIDLSLNAKTVKLNNKGVGNITLIGYAEDATIYNTGIGSFQAGNFTVQTMDLKNSGIGSAVINAAKTLRVSSTGIGSVKNKGAAPMPKKKSTMVI